MTPQQFIEKWRRANLRERSAYQQHFCDLCELLNQEKPAAADPDGTWYTFDRGVRKTTGEKGFADVWMRSHFGWEYKGKHKDLKEAYQQLNLYREDLENPPLLVVCDLDRFEVHTNFTGTAKQVHRFDLSGLADPASLDILRKLFTDPEALRPDMTSAGLTEEVAKQFAVLADGMWLRGVPAEQAAHFLMKLMFCMFGEDIGLLPPRLFTSLVEKAKRNPAMLSRRLEGLFAAMARGGDFGADEIPYFNGGLFADADVVPLTPEEINILLSVAGYDWSGVEPSIFGTLFERTLDPGKRSQIGAHYTSREDIVTLLEPVLMAPLRREWAAVKVRCETQLWPAVETVSRSQAGRRRAGAKPSTQRRRFDRAIQDFTERLSHVTVLDPACGSGNFLYVAINLLLNLEREVISYAAARGLALVPHVRPTQLSGLEINPYAQQLAQVVIWIGYLQWMHHNGFKAPSDPVLEPIESIRCTDAILDLSDPAHPKEPEWPAAEFIVGNPPFLGTKMLRGGLGDEYVQKLFAVYTGRIPGFSDLCCYWFEKGRAIVEKWPTTRVGLLATQAIRNEAARVVLQRVLDTGDVFFAESDREWILDGAAVHISMIGFTGHPERVKTLNGKEVTRINANLTAGADTTLAKTIEANRGIAFVGDVKGGPFDVPFSEANELGRQPAPNGRPPFDVIRPYTNGLDITRRLRNVWIVDFGEHISEAEAAGYGSPFEHLVKHVRPMRDAGRPTRSEWWLHMRPCPSMRQAVGPLRRYIATPTLTKYRLFVWMSGPTLPDHQLVVFAREDDYFFGVLHSRIHEVWALRQGTQLETRPRYTPTTCFETFPLPEIGGLGVPAAGAAQAPPNRVGWALPTANGSRNAVGEAHPTVAAIAAAARELDGLRNRWLNPPEWTKTEILEFPGSVDGPWARYVDLATVQPPVSRKRERVAAEPPGEGGVKAPGNMPSPPAPLPKVEGRTPSPPAPLPQAGEGSVGTVRWPRIVPKDADCAESLKRRTLTNLYNQRPEWLNLAHQKLDEAVFAAYGWPPGLSDEEIIERLLELNLARTEEQS